MSIGTSFCVQQVILANRLRVCIGSKHKSQPGFFLQFLRLLRRVHADGNNFDSRLLDFSQLSFDSP